MKKRAFTLIEVIASLAIISILLVVSFKGIKYYEFHVEKIQNISVLYDFKDFLSYAKTYCYENQQAGEVYFDNCDDLNKVYLISQGSIVKTIYITKTLKIYNANFVTKDKKFIMLKINNDGYIEPYTLSFIDENNNVKKIVIQVGGNLIYIKDE